MAQLNLQYDNMNDAIANLKTLVVEFESTTTNMTTNVTSLCDNWTATSSPVYREDFTKLSTNFTNTIELVREMIADTESYIAKMDEVDQGYAKPKISNA